MKNNHDIDLALKIRYLVSITKMLQALSLKLTSQD